MNLLPLSHIASVRMGVTLRGRDATRPDPNGSCYMIRIGDINDEGQLITHELLRFEPNESIKRDHFLRAGDILLPNRGNRCTAYVFDLPLDGVIVGAQFYVIRVQHTKILPSYLAWFLRTTKAAIHFALRRKGTLVQNVQLKDVLELELPLPCIEKQQNIVELDALLMQERELTERLADLNQLLHQSLMLHHASFPQ
jgi:hypothetical protein